MIQLPRTLLAAAATIAVIAITTPASAATQLSLGPSAHACAVTEAGGARCWGFNSSGQLGTGNTTNSSTAVDVSGLTSGIAAVAAGASHTCALTTAGGVKCWGLNTSGQVGDGTTTQRLTPVDVSGLSSGVTAIAVGGDFSCALISGGGAKCWGADAVGQLGNGASGASTTPVDVDGLTSGVAHISAAFQHACAVTASGGAKCWGRNDDGRLGDGTNTSPRTSPVDVSGLASGIAQIEAGAGQTCARTTVGAMKCWGENENGQLGNASEPTDSNVPVDVSGLASGVAQMGLGGNQPRFAHVCAVTTAGAVKCWGHNNSGQLGNGTQTDSATPVDVTGLTSGVTQVDVGNLYTCARLASGQVKCWGAGAGGVLGNGTTTSSNTAVDVVGLRSPQTITFAAITDKTFGDAAFTANATATSALPVTLTSTTTGICTTSGLQITLVGAGTCNVVASQAGNASFDPAPDVARSFSVAKAAQSLTFNTPADKTFGDAAFALSATASSGLAPSFASQPANTCSVSGSTVTLIAAGACTIEASQAGNANFLSATAVARTFTIAKGTQAISFGALANRRLSASPVSISASSSSGLAVSFASQTPTTCSVSGTSVTLTALGVCTIQASQAGDANFLAAANVAQSFTVTRSGGGGGGCSIGSTGNDYGLLLLLFALLGYRMQRRR